MYAAEVPAAPAQPPASSAPQSQSRSDLSKSDLSKSEVPRSEVPLWDRPLTVPGAEPGRRSGGEDVTARFPGWDTVRFYPFEEPAPAPAVPEPREGQEGAEPGAQVPGALVPEAAADAPVPLVRPGLLAGRRPAPLLLVAALALLTGAYSGVLLAMLGGWGAAYLSRGIGDFTKKFAVLGIPMICMTGATVWFWGRAQGRWGTPVSAGTPMGEMTWSAAPGVLRVAAVLTALFLLAVTLRRRRES